MDLPGHLREKLHQDPTPDIDSGGRGGDDCDCKTILTQSAQDVFLDSIIIGHDPMSDGWKVLRSHFIVASARD
jgi:hypothetical protein